MMNKREIVEANFIFTLWKEPHMYHDFIHMTKEDFMTEMGWFYYKVGLDMFNAKFSEYDEISLSTYFSDKKKFKRYI